MGGLPALQRSGRCRQSEDRTFWGGLPHGFGFEHREEFIERRQIRPGDRFGVGDDCTRWAGYRLFNGRGDAGNRSDRTFWGGPPHGFGFKQATNPCPLSTSWMVQSTTSISVMFASLHANFIKPAAGPA